MEASGSPTTRGIPPEEAAWWAADDDIITPLSAPSKRDRPPLTTRRHAPILLSVISSFIEFVGFFVV